VYVASSSDKEAFSNPGFCSVFLQNPNLFINCEDHTTCSKIIMTYEHVDDYQLFTLLQKGL